MDLAAELERVAGLAAETGGADGDVVSGVIPTEPAPGRRVYPVRVRRRGRATAAGSRVREDGTAVESRTELREAVSIAALCEVATDAAGGGDLDALIARLEELRRTEAPEGIEDAEEAARALRAVLGDAAAGRDAGAARRDRRGDPAARARARSDRRVAVHGRDEVVAGRGLRSSSARSRPGTGCRSPNLAGMESGGGGFFPFGGGDPEDLLGALREFAEKQAETVQDAQREQYATLTLNTAVELTAAALGRIQVEGSSDAQAIALRDAMRVLFPEAVALVSAARQGFMRT